MITSISRHKQFSLACAIVLVASSASYAAEVQATKVQPIILAQKFPPNGEPTGRRRGGTSRGENCPDLETPVTAIVPGDENNNKSLFASTVAEYPTFWVYLPKLPDNLRSGEFVLQDEQGQDIYRTPLTLPRKPGALSIALPSNPKYALKLNSKYQWFFRVYCNNKQQIPSDYFFVDAWLQRVALTPNLQQELNKAKAKEHTVYTANNLWYDAITSLGERRRDNPNDRLLAEEWAKLLKTMGLLELAQEPILHALE
ncbi:hypothetical protein WA1_20810 [Scytonema hofmannii PCC 7110]|uniref:DUF928 domain-containing protein n=1 Tax=Scytonema hofmannii PCC 7110 TaxID=128403 RepID=A0A139XCI8_9CYAN|nr:DUF928 domain-containing protein [Scytonema hofmannii]KYC42409.1 hypothetical protein WA1_20810 [Scytonema hofmannii PCC 7110]